MSWHLSVLKLADQLVLSVVDVIFWQLKLFSNHINDIVIKRELERLLRLLTEHLNMVIYQRADRYNSVLAIFLKDVIEEVHIVIALGRSDVDAVNLYWLWVEGFLGLKLGPGCISKVFMRLNHRLVNATERNENYLGFSRVLFMKISFKYGHPHLVSIMALFNSLIEELLNMIINKWILFWPELQGKFLNIL